MALATIAVASLVLLCFWAHGMPPIPTRGLSTRFLRVLTIPAAKTCVVATPPVYDQAPPVGAPVGEGSRRGNRQEEHRLRENARRSRCDNSPSCMEDELHNLRKQVREQHELIFSLKQGIERAELDRNQALDRVAFMERSQPPPPQ